MKVNKTLNMNIESIIDDDSDENEFTNGDKSSHSILEVQSSEHDKATLNSYHRSRLYAHYSPPKVGEYKNYESRQTRQ